MKDENGACRNSAGFIFVKKAAFLRDGAAIVIIAKENTWDEIRKNGIMITYRNSGQKGRKE